MSNAPRDPDLAAFVDKHRARWPEWQLAEVFLPEAQRPVAAAWLALLQELGDAAWGGEDPTPGLAKLAWWQEELQGWRAGRRRHPLGRVLKAGDIPWDALAVGVGALPGSRERPTDTGEAIGALGPVAVAAAQVEADLFGVPAAAASSGDLASALLAERLLHHRATAAPLAVQAEAGDAAERAWAGLLLSTWPRGPVVSRPRRLHAMLQRARLHQLAAGRTDPEPMSRWATLWQGWRSARRDPAG
ncbi:phytoene synthase [Luteimonas pelagia]